MRQESVLSSDYLNLKNHVESLKNAAAVEPSTYKNNHFTKGKPDICGVKLWLLKPINVMWYSPLA